MTAHRRSRTSIPMEELFSVEEQGRLHNLDEEIGEIQDALAPSPQHGTQHRPSIASPSNRRESHRPSLFDADAEDLRRRAQVQEAQVRQLRSRLEDKDKLWTELLRKKDEQITLVLKREKAVSEKMRFKVKKLEDRYEEVRKELLALQKKTEVVDPAVMKAKEDGAALQMRLRDDQDRTIRTLQTDQHRLIAEFHGAKSQDMRLFLAKAGQQGAPSRGDSDEAPTGEVCIAFTDVQNSTYLWDQATGDMMTALQLHNSLFRKLIKKHGGYEVKTEGDAFMVAFTHAEHAVSWALEIQTGLMEEPWPEGLMRFADAKEEWDAGTLLWRGLRVRIGIHSGRPSCEADPLTKRMDYFGPMVNQSARVAGSGRGGEVVCSGEIHHKLLTARTRLECDRVPLGKKQFKGLSEMIDCWRLVPHSLRARVFPEKPALAEAASGAATESLSFLDWVVREEQRRDEAPPEGDVALVFTDVQSSTFLWDRETDAMWEALTSHNQVMRQLIADNAGYEVKTEGDAFMVAFSDPACAVRFCKSVQIELLGVDWPAALMEHAAAGRETDKRGRTIWNGLRVRCGIHYGRPGSVRDPVTKRMDYFGPMVNLAARVGGAAQGGEIVCSAPIEKAVREGVGFDSMDMLPAGLGFQEFKGVTQPQEIFRLTPRSLMTRDFTKKDTVPRPSNAPENPPTEELFLKMAEQTQNQFILQTPDARKLHEVCAELVDVMLFLTDGGIREYARRTGRRPSDELSPRSRGKESGGKRRASHALSITNRGSDKRLVKQGLKDNPHARRDHKDPVKPDDLVSISAELKECIDFILTLAEGALRKALKHPAMDEKVTVAFGTAIRRGTEEDSPTHQPSPHPQPVVGWFRRFSNRNSADKDKEQEAPFGAGTFDTGVSGIRNRGRRGSTASAASSPRQESFTGLVLDSQEDSPSPPAARPPDPATPRRVIGHSPREELSIPKEKWRTRNSSNRTSTTSPRGRSASGTPASKPRSNATPPNATPPTRATAPATAPVRPAGRRASLDLTGLVEEETAPPTTAAPTPAPNTPQEVGLVLGTAIAEPSPSPHKEQMSDRRTSDANQPIHRVGSRGSRGSRGSTASYDRGSRGSRTSLSVRLTPYAATKATPPPLALVQHRGSVDNGTSGGPVPSFGGGMGLGLEIRGTASKWFAGQEVGERGSPVGTHLDSSGRGWQADPAAPPGSQPGRRDSPSEKYPKNSSRFRPAVPDSPRQVSRGPGQNSPGNAPVLSTGTAEHTPLATHAPTPPERRRVTPVGVGAGGHRLSADQVTASPRSLAGRKSSAGRDSAGRSTSRRSVGSTSLNFPSLVPGAAGVRPPKPPGNGAPGRSRVSRSSSLAAQFEAPMKGAEFPQPQAPDFDDVIAALQPDV
eukprot:Hpha_TRINITY_DN10122_c0_g1::TRINITY_DN10122_c0_g1_i1::g.131622::m.131622